MFFQISVLVFSDIFPEVGSLGHKTDPFLIFWGISILLSSVASPVCIPTKSAKRLPYFTSSLVLVFWFIDKSHSGRCEMISHCGFKGFNAELAKSVLRNLSTSRCGKEKVAILDILRYVNVEFLTNSTFCNSLIFFLFKNLYCSQNILRQIFPNCRESVHFLKNCIKERCGP